MCGYRTHEQAESAGRDGAVVSAPIDDGGPAFRCRVCKATMVPKPYQVRKGDYECAPCKRSRQNLRNRSDAQFAAKRREYNSRPDVRVRNSAYQSSRMRSDPFYATIRAARRKVATEVEAGRMQRSPCVVCGSARSEAHHEDYLDALNVKWLCRRHHIAADVMLAQRKRGGAS